MTAGSKQVSIWLVVAVTALLTALLTLGLDRGVARLQASPTPTPDVRNIIVTVQTVEPVSASSVVPGDDAQVQGQMALHLGYIFVQKAERQVSFALEALAANDGGRADSELVAAKASLDAAFGLAPEDLKPQIDTERIDIGRIRADLESNPNGLDQELQNMRDRLLSLIVPRP